MSQNRKNHKQARLPIGHVRIIGFDEVIPEGWEKMFMEEGRQYANELSALLSSWSIVAFEVGALTGRNYGGKFWEHYGKECGEGFIILREPKTKA